MFKYMDTDGDNLLTYQDFANLKFNICGPHHSDLTKSNDSGISEEQDPFRTMEQDVRQRKEFDLMEWDDDIQGSTEQKKFQTKQMSKGTFVPREYGGDKVFPSTKSYLAQQTHGLPSGFSTSDKKGVWLKLIGGNFYGVLHNQYFTDQMDEAQSRDSKYHEKISSNKIDFRRMMKNRAQNLRQNFNRRKVQILNSMEKEGKILIRDDINYNTHQQNMHKLY